jgi:hypothetical protein
MPNPLPMSELQPRLGSIEATNMLVKPIGTVVSAAGSQPNGLGGD